MHPTNPKRNYTNQQQKKIHYNTKKIKANPKRISSQWRKCFPKPSHLHFTSSLPFKLLFTALIHHHLLLHFPWIEPSNHKQKSKVIQLLWEKEEVKVKRRNMDKRKGLKKCTYHEIWACHKLEIGRWETRRHLHLRRNLEIPYGSPGNTPSALPY